MEFEQSNLPELVGGGGCLKFRADRRIISMNILENRKDDNFDNFVCGYYGFRFGLADFQ